MRYAPIDSSMFIENRGKFLSRLKPKSIAVFLSNDVMPTSADGVRSFIQDADFFYMTGIDQEESILILCPDTREERHREILFIRQTDEKTVTWEGHKLTMEEARTLSGIRTVYWTSEFNRILRGLAIESEHIYLNRNEHSRAETPVETRSDRFMKRCMMEYPLHRYERAAPIMHGLRAVKSDIEVELIQTAIGISDKAFRRALLYIAPGVWEYEIEAELNHEFLMNRSRGPAYETIIASGANACVLHYVKNDDQCRDGDLVLMDFGAEYANYVSDVTRTVPVNGRFSQRQREVYDSVLRIQREAMQLLRPGMLFRDYNREVGSIVERELIGLGLINSDEILEQNPDNPMYRKYYMHGTSHLIGLNVHDVGDGIHHAMKKGMVVSCEPGIYIKEEGMGIRLENDIFITDNGPVDLTVSIPIDADEIEELMSRPTGR
ncbi:MAG: aminopeptidase P N-terminal domain-containing protein [Deltaproteobacteria bacterium]|nr:aminopeptidase P N-terminal domain-containing protein [Deltaproteobacteria bacterium]